MEMDFFGKIVRLEAGFRLVQASYLLLGDVLFRFSGFRGKF